MTYADFFRRSLVPVLLVLIAAAGLPAQTFSVLRHKVEAKKDSSVRTGTSGQASRRV